MNLLIAGGDMRFAWAARLARERGLRVWTLGLEACSLPRAPLEAIRAAEAVLMANPWRGAYPGPYAVDAPAPAQVFEAMNPDALLVLPDRAGMPAEGAPKHVCLSGNEAYTLRNARLTAEGAVHAAMAAVPFALEGAPALVIGYGRIGRRLARLLRALGCEVTVAARREAARRQAEADGARACPMEELSARLPSFRLIFSTPPATVLDAGALRAVSPDALLMDLASPPFGFSLEEARALGLNAVRENNLPGRYCPETAGRLLLDAAMNAIERGAVT